MPSLTSPNPLWALDLTALSIDEINGHLIEARHVLGFLQAELTCRTHRSQIDAENIANTEKRLHASGLVAVDQKRPADLAEDRQAIYASTSPLDRAEKNALREFALLVGQLITPGHTALAYVTFSKSILMGSNINEKSMIIKSLYGRRDRLSNSIQNQLLTSPLSEITPCQNHDEYWINVVLSNGTMLKILVLCGGKNIPSCLLLRASAVSLTWGCDGEVLPSNALPPVFANAENSRECLHELSKRKAISISINSFQEEYYTVFEKLQQRIETAGLTSALKALALMLVMHSFPKHRHIEPIRLVRIYQPLCIILTVFKAMLHWLKLCYRFSSMCYNILTKTLSCKA